MQQKELAPTPVPLLTTGRFTISQHSLIAQVMVFISALLVRLTYNFTVAASYQPNYDAALYDVLGRHIIRRGCYCLYQELPNVSRPPLWPFIMSVLYTFTGINPLYPRLFYCLLGSLTCLLVYLFARELLSPRMALLTGFIAAIYPGLFLYDGWLYSESLYTFCLVAFAYALYQSQQPQQQSNLTGAIYALRYRWDIVAGIFLACATLTRPNGITSLIVVASWAVWLVMVGKRSWREMLLKAAITASIALVLVAPWTYRNYQATGQFILVSTGLGEVVNGAYNNNVAFGDKAIRGYWRPPAGSNNHDKIQYTPADDKADTQRGLTWIKEHLPTMPYMFYLHFINNWVPYAPAYGLPMEQAPELPSSQLLFRFIPLASYPIFFAALVGSIIAWKCWRTELIAVYLLLTITMLLNIALYSNMRFRAPMEPFLVLFTGVALSWVGAWLRRSKLFKKRLEW